jgi:spore germination protein YaaH
MKVFLGGRLMFKKVLLSLLLLTAFINADTSRSFHFLEIERHRDVKPPVFYGEPSVEPVDLGLRFSPVTDKLIYGYLPYWNNSTTHIRWGLMTDLLYFSCEMEPGGTLGNCNGWPQSAPIDEARKYGVRIHLVITSFTKGDIFDLLGSTTQKNTFFNAVWDKVKDDKADGVNIDFEAFGKVDPSSLLTNFFNELAQFLKSKKSDMIVSVAMPAVDWSNNWDLAGMTDMDYFFMMLYDYHWRGGEPGPVAPLYRESPWTSSGRSVTRSINDYISANGDAIKNKLIAGYPYYGYKWKTTNGSIPGTKVENAVSAVYDKVYSDYSSVTSLWDDGSQTPYKIWQEGSSWYQLWYDNAESLGMKFELVNTHGLAGSGMWAVNYDVSKDDLWKELAKYFVIDKSGSFSNPVKIEAFPFAYEGDTYKYVSYELDSYSCDVTGNYTGPEIIFEFELASSGSLTAALSKGYGKSGERESHGIYLLSDDKECISGDTKEISLHLEDGKYYISVDSTVDENVYKGGPFTLEINFVSDDPVEETDDDYEEYDDDPQENFDKDKEIDDEDVTKADEDDGYKEDPDIDYEDCVYEGTEYEHDEIFEKGDGCNMCHCYNGYVVCSEKPCPENKKSKGCSITVL